MAELKVSFTIEDVEIEEEDDSVDNYIRDMVKEIGEGLCANTSYLIIEES